MKRLYVLYKNKLKKLKANYVKLLCSIDNIALKFHSIVDILYIFAKQQRQKILQQKRTLPLKHH